MSGTTGLLSEFRFIITLMVVMIIFGAFGGVINYLIKQKPDEGNTGKPKKDILKCVTLGIGASFLVPLFLKLLSSDIIEKDQSKQEDLLVFAGLCLVAAISSTSFIKTISGALMKRMEKSLADGGPAEISAQKKSEDDTPNTLST